MQVQKIDGVETIRNAEAAGRPSQALEVVEAALADDLLEARVAALLRRTPGVPVFVKGDRAVPYGRVVEAMTLLQRAGAARVGFITEPTASSTSARAAAI